MEKVPKYRNSEIDFYILCLSNYDLKKSLIVSEFKEIHFQKEFKKSEITIETLERKNDVLEEKERKCKKIEEI